jgi:hypothetical protein
MEFDSAQGRDRRMPDLRRTGLPPPPRRMSPRPVIWVRPGAHPDRGAGAGAARAQSGKPFTDPSGDRLRDWMGVDEDDLLRPRRVAILPMAFCFPGYDAKGSDLPPPPGLRRTWRARAMAASGQVRLTLLIGGYAQRLAPGRHGGVTATRGGLARPCARGLPLAASVLAQYRVAEAKSVVRGRASAGSARAGEGGSGMTTPLDDAFTAMEAEGTDAARLRWFDRLAASELFLLLEAEAEGDRVRPRRLRRWRTAAFICVFDREDRLSGFAGEAAPYASLSGRALSGMLAGQGLGPCGEPGHRGGDAARCRCGGLAGGDAGHAPR